MSYMNTNNNMLSAIEFLSQQGETTKMKCFVAALIAETIFAAEWKNVRNFFGDETSNQIVKLIMERCNNAGAYNSLKKYNRESLNLLIEKEWNLPDCLCLLPKGKECWAYEYDEHNGEISFKKYIDTKKKYKEEKGKDYPVNIPLCGDKIYVETIKKGTRSRVVSVSINNDTANVWNETNELKTSVKVDLLSLYRALVDCRGGDEVVKTFNYIWQWKITCEEYNAVRKILTSEDCKKYIKEIYVENKNCLFIVVAYLAEYFKREWNGNNGVNVLAGIGLDGESSSIAQEYFGGKRQEYRIFQHDSGSHEWLRSIQVEGGLPVHYVVNKQATSLAGFAYNIWGDRKDVEDALEDLNDKTLIHSYQSGYSIYAYVNEIRNGGIVNICSDGDRCSKLYKDFIDFLEEGRNLKIQDKFYIRYRVWKSNKQFTIYRTLRMRECNCDGYDEFPADVISVKRLTGLWGIAEPSYVFALSFDKIRHQFVPNNTVDAEVTSYRSSTWESEFELPALSSDNASTPIVVNYVSQDKNYVIPLSPELKFPSEGYIEFRKVNNFEWKDKESCRVRSEVAAVLYDTDKWTVRDVDNFSPVQGYGWVEFSESIELVSSKTDRKNKKLYNSVERVWVEPDSDSIHPIAKLPYVKIENNKIRIEGNGLEQDAYLLQYPVKFDAIQLNTYRKLQIESVEYRKPDDCRYEKYRGNGAITGYVIFRITTNGVQSKPIHCYILPPEATITRHIEERQGKITYSCPNRDNKRISDTFTDDSVNEDYRSVRVDDGVCSFDLNVVRPFRRRDRFREDAIDGTNDAIPIRFSNQYQVRVMDENGVSRKFVDADCRPKLMSRLRETVLDKKTNNTKIKVDSQFTYQAYTKPIEYNRQLQKYYADSGNDVNAENICFKFLALNDDILTDITLGVEIGTGNCKYLTLNIDNKSDGVILQSLYDKNGNKLSPISYYEPIYVSSNRETVDNATKTHLRIKRLCQYVANGAHPLEMATFKHFDFVCSCGCYFIVMDRLYALTYVPSCCNGDRKCNANIKVEYCDGGVHIKSCNIRKRFSTNSVEVNLAKFYLGYCEYCSMNNKQVNYVELWRMAEELGFDWLLIPRNIWLKITGNCVQKKELVVKLLMYRPKEFYKNLLENYWDLKWKVSKGGRGAYNFMKYILTAEGECPDIIPDREEVNKELNRLNNV